MLTGTNKKEENVCTVKGCNNLRFSGNITDNLLCSNCREKWKRVCERNYIMDKQVSESTINTLLKEFQEKSYGMSI